MEEMETLRSSSVKQKRSRLAVAQDVLDTVKSEHGSLRLLAVPENEKAIESTPFPEYRWNNVECDGEVEHYSKISLLEVFSAVKKCWTKCVKAP
ncbi:hypothetical protein TNCV_1675211 [Trichonephila clavipes]|nr:hypothetical protein TNCV_1675211 [Trichonephila clavipes]